MTAHDILKAARELIATPDRWTQGHGALTATGHVVSVQSERAVCFCASAAFMRVKKHTDSPTVDEAYFALLDAITESQGFRPVSLIHWNDSPRRTHAEVLAAFDAAIEATA